MLKFFLFFCSHLVVFLASAYMGSSILMFFSLIFWWSFFSALRLFKCWKLAILIPWQSGCGSELFSVYNSMETALLSIFHLHFSFSLSRSLSLFLARSLSYTWLLFLQLWSTLQVRNFDVFIHSFLMEPFLQCGCSGDEKFWFWAMIVMLWLWILSIVL